MLANGLTWWTWTNSRTVPPYFRRKEKPHTTQSHGYVRWGIGEGGCVKRFCRIWPPRTRDELRSSPARTTSIAGVQSDARLLFTTQTYLRISTERSRTSAQILPAGGGHHSLARPAVTGIHRPQRTKEDTAPCRVDPRTIGTST